MALLAETHIDDHYLIQIVDQVCSDDVSPSRAVAVIYRDGHFVRPDLWTDNEAAMARRALAKWKNR